MFDADGRFAPEYDEAETEEVQADTVYVAIGQRVMALPLVEGTEGLEMTPRGLIVADPDTLETSRPGLFAGGELVACQGRERLEYVIPHVSPSGITGAPAVTRTEPGGMLKAPREISEETLDL